MFEQLRNAVVYMLLGALALFVVQQQQQQKAPTMKYPPHSVRSGSGKGSAEASHERADADADADKAQDDATDAHEPVLYVNLLVVDASEAVKEEVRAKLDSKLPKPRFTRGLLRAKVMEKAGTFGERGRRAT